MPTSAAIDPSAPLTPAQCQAVTGAATRPGRSGHSRRTLKRLFCFHTLSHEPGGLRGLCARGQAMRQSQSSGVVCTERGNETVLGLRQQGRPLLPFNETGTSDSVQVQDRPQPPQLSPVPKTPHRPYRAAPLRYWQSDNRTSTAVLPHLRATQKGNLARPHSRSQQTVQKPGGHAIYCHLHRGDWSSPSDEREDVRSVG